MRKEGTAEERIAFVGNIMIDTLEAQRARAAERKIEDIVQRELLFERTVPALPENGFAVITMHRPSNVDQAETLIPLIEFLTGEVAQELPLLWPIHPRARKQLELFGLWEKVVSTKLMLTDSGGLQEECCVLGTPCLTLRWNTERPITLKEHGGASFLVGNEVTRIRQAFLDVMNSTRRPQRPELWDGHTAERIVEALIRAGKC